MYARPEDCASLMAGRSGAEWLWRMIYSSVQGRYCSRPKKRQRQVNRHSLARHDRGDGSPKDDPRVSPGRVW
ncbi:hypothetical protein HMPREF3197_04057 [Klebsiella pneumoniae]|nr:hypothetical protein HMPREF9538_01140 [Klebsiella sp. MS 92-3]KXA22598.1 hypothetical protein HMPREF3197_04057 [Klebsiella pneumoniae]